MFITITESIFIDAFRASKRGKSWSYEGLLALYELLTELEDDCGNYIEFDLIGIDGDFYEQSVEEIINDYDHLIDPNDIDPDNVADSIGQFLVENTIAIKASNGNFVYSRF